MPDGGCTFLETGSIRGVIQRPLSGSPMSGEEIIDLLVDAAWED